LNKTIFGLALLGLLALVPGLWAQPTIDFSAGSAATGTIGYAGGSAPLVGTNITETEVAGKNTVLNNLVSLLISSGSLNFTTGASNGSWSWGPGGSLSITGTIPAQTPAGGTAFPGTSGTLLSGTLVSASVIPASGTFLVSLGAFVSSANSDLSSYYGLPADIQVGNFNLSFQVAGGASSPDAFASTSMGSGDVTGTVPTPGLLVLLCSGGTVSLLGCAWRRTTQRAA
jgi:hypothetical protein